MSQENVEAVRAMLKAWNERCMDSFREMHDPNVVILRFIEDWPDPAPIAGRAAVMEWFDGMRPGDDDTAEPVSDFSEAGGAVVVRILWRTSSHGHEVGMESTVVYALRSGKIAAIEFFLDHSEALKAVGLQD